MGSIPTQPTMIKNCAFCKAEYSTNLSASIYCSKPCYSKAKRRRFVERNKAKIIIKICIECSQEFEVCKPYSFRNKLCSQKCVSSHNSRKLKKFIDIPSCLEDASRKLDKKLGYVRIYVPMHPEVS